MRKVMVGEKRKVVLMVGELRKEVVGEMRIVVVWDDKGGGPGDEEGGGGPGDEEGGGR